MSLLFDFSVFQPFCPVTPVGETTESVCGGVIELIEADLPFGIGLNAGHGRFSASEERQQGHQEKYFGHGFH